MKTCREVGALLYEYVEGALDPGLSRELDAHLDDCPGCIASVNTYRQTVHLSNDLRCEDIPPDLQRKLRSFIKQKLRQPSLWARLRTRLPAPRKP